MPKSSKSKKKQKRKNSRMSKQVPNTAIQYRGPISLPLKSTQAELYRSLLFQTVPAITSGGGVISIVVSTSLNQWDENASFAALFDEWRLLGATCEYVPYSTVPTNTLTANGGFVLVADRDSANALTGVLQGLEQGGKLKNMFTKFSCTYRMLSSEEASFTGSNTSNAAWFKMAASSLAAAQTYGALVVKGLWQFRGRV